jgi:hypothetical protein
MAVGIKLFFPIFIIFLLSACDGRRCPADLEGTYQYEDTNYFLKINDKKSYTICTSGTNCRTGGILYSETPTTRAYTFEGMTIDGSSKTILADGIGEFTPTCSWMPTQTWIQVTREPNTWFMPVDPSKFPRK